MRDMVDVGGRSKEGASYHKIRIIRVLCICRLKCIRLPMVDVPWVCSIFKPLQALQRRSRVRAESVRNLTAGRFFQN